MQIETADLYRAIKRLIENNFENIPVQTKDKKNPNPPCFYIDYVSRVDTQTATEFENNSILFDVVYFSEEETLRDLIRKEKVLRNIFRKPLKVEITLTENNDEFTVCKWQEIDSLTFTFNEDDYILNCSLEISVNQSIEETDDSEYMDELELKINVKKEV